MTATQADPVVQETDVATWPELLAAFDELQSVSDSDWIFRGQRESGWGLETSLERALMTFQEREVPGAPEERRRFLREIMGREFAECPIADVEAGLVQRFKRQCKQFTPSVPNEHETLEWLALMQDYHAPTRLLDWTYSFYVAAYFALAEPQSQGAIWGINVAALRQRAKANSEICSRWKLIGEYTGGVNDPELFQRLFVHGPPFVYVVRPFHLNHRISIQQGVFLLPGQLQAPFMDNLAATQLGPGDIRKIKVAGAPREKFAMLRQLYRMNLHPAALFPGLDGFGQTMRTLLVFPEYLTSGRKNSWT